MNSNKSWIEVPEAEAKGEIASIYDDIRTIIGVPFVNLIYRNLAGIPGGLAEAWSFLRPLHASNATAHFGSKLVQQASLPDLPKIPATYLEGAGLTINDRKQISAILDFYIRGNMMNLLAMSALTQKYTCNWVTPPPVNTYPRLIPLEYRNIKPLVHHNQLSVASLVDSLNKLGEGSTPDIVAPSLFRHLAHWPMFLCISGTYLLPQNHNGTLSRGALAMADSAASLAAIMLKGMELAARSEASNATILIRELADHFANISIPRLLIICLILRTALPD
jgi:hypothetical protein